jgi:hypothetical protein
MLYDSGCGVKCLVFRDKGPGYRGKSIGLVGYGLEFEG